MNGIFLKLVVFLCVFGCMLYHPCSASGEVDSNCTKCECCNGKTCKKGTYFDNECSNGCIDGHRGARCYELCAIGCTKCRDDFAKCTECYDGFFLDIEQNCNQCPHNCKQCSSSNTCTVCKDGFQNGVGSRTCEDSICPEHCNCNLGDGDCISCKDGFFNIDASCNLRCPLSCLTCASLAICNECQNGYFNGYKLIDGNNIQFNNCTHTCRETCTSCSSYDKCLECPKGKYGSYCQTDCSLGCRDHICVITTGECNCLSNFSGEKCNECAYDRYGEKCGQYCPVNCNNGSCDKHLGHCTAGCKKETIIGNKCDSCVIGMYGMNCEIFCPENCKDNKCDKDTGTCLEGCKENFLGGICDECIISKYGDDCQHDCPKSCFDKECQKETGHCAKCLANFIGDRCQSCKAGFYGLNCEKACSPNCFTKGCDKDTGRCDSGCKINYSGDKCCVSNNNCVKCSSNTDCEECKTGYFQASCEGECSRFCRESCKFSTGICNDCMTNQFGPFCNMTCSENCDEPQSNVSRCEQSNGECLFGCRDGFFGTTCNETCSSYCIDKICLKENGVCVKGCRGQQNNEACPLQQAEKPTTADPSNHVGPIAGGVSAALLAIITGIVFIVCFIKRRQKGMHSQQQSSHLASEGQVYHNSHETQLLDEDVKENKTKAQSDTIHAVDINEVELDERSNDTENMPDETYYNLGKSSHSVKVNDLFTYVNTHVDTFANEFGNLAKDLDLTQHCTIAKKPENLPLNRYNGIYPYNHSRVTIAGQPEFFINACYIDGYKNRQKEYIASLGPTAKTTYKFSTFWLMVWNEKSDIIVMLTNLREASGMKCEKYWPDSDKQEDYGQIEVKCRSVEVFAEYTVRTFSISKGKAKRNVVQLHYTAWPDKGVPEEVTSLVEFRQRVKAVPSILGGPVIIHCSAGVGRTGTYIALDQLTEEGKCEGSVDVFNCVNRMRQQRVNMVQTADQYKFLYKSLVHSLSFGCEAMTAEEIQGLTYKTDGTSFTDMFETLQQEVDIESKEDMEDRQENKERHKDKNRRHSDIPANRSRVRLYLARADGQHDYINAVFINSFKTKNLFIAAQSPLPGTVEDFICMIYQQNSSCVVALEESHNHNDLGKYLPADNETYKCGDFTVTSSKCETKEQYILKKVSIQTAKKSEEKAVYHFQYTKWGRSNTVPEKVEDFVHFIKDVEKIISRQTEDQPHIVVHCLSGYERTGLFCVIYKLLEKLEAERQVSVVNTVRKIRTHRKQSITSVEQLKFCYQCISAYLEIYNTYSNFAT